MKKASTISEWCEEHRLSVSFFYKLQKAGCGPRVTKVGTRSIITEEDAAAWRRAMSESSTQPAAA